MGIPEFHQIPYTKYPKSMFLSFPLNQNVYNFNIHCSFLTGAKVVNLYIQLSTKNYDLLFFFLVVGFMFIAGLISFIALLRIFTDPSLYDSIYFK